MGRQLTERPYWLHNTPPRCYHCSIGTGLQSSQAEVLNAAGQHHTRSTPLRGWPLLKSYLRGKQEACARRRDRIVRDNSPDEDLEYADTYVPEELITDPMAQGSVTPVEDLERQLDSFPSSSLQLALLHPGGNAQQAARTAPPVQRNRVHDYLIRAKNNVGPLRGLLLSFGISVIYSIVYWIFIYFVLIRGNIQVGSVLFDASKTNLLVSIFSQFAAILFDMVIRDLFGCLRLGFANTRRGFSLVNFLGMGASSSWLSTLEFTVIKWVKEKWRGLFNLWCELRLAIPIMGLAFGSVLKCNNLASLAPSTSRGATDISPSPGRFLVLLRL